MNQHFAFPSLHTNLMLNYLMDFGSLCVTASVISVNVDLYEYGLDLNVFQKKNRQTCEQIYIYIHNQIMYLNGKNIHIRTISS